MATAARKARKRSGEKFEKAPKTATPAQDRAYVNQLVPGAHGTRYANSPMGVPRSEKKVDRYLEGRTV